MNRHSSGFANLLLIFTVVIFGIGTLGYYAYKNGQIKLIKKDTEIETNTYSTPANSNIVTPTSTNNITTDWKTYINHNFGFSFKYPPNYNTECCSISGPPTNDKDLITIADVPQNVGGSDAPFNGLAIYIRDNIGNQTFEQFIDKENALLLEFYKYSDYGDPDPNIKEAGFTFSNQNGIVLEGFDVLGKKRYYFKLPNREEVVLISRLDRSSISKTFEKEFDQILSTFEFTN